MEATPSYKVGFMGFMIVFYICFRGSFYVILLILFVLMVAGDRVSKEWDGSELAASSRMMSS